MFAFGGGLVLVAFEFLEAFADAHEDKHCRLGFFLGGWGTLWEEGFVGGFVGLGGWRL